MKRLLPSFLCITLTACSNAPHRETSSIEGAQQAFYPDRYEPRVGDLILSLPVGYYESAPFRLNFAKQILETGSPKPVAMQEVYLKIPADGLAPTKHFFALDARHLLIFSEQQDLDGGHPPQFEVFKRIGDATWKDATSDLLPTSIQKPLRVDFDAAGKTFTVTVSDKRTEAFRWNGSRIIPVSKS